MSRPPLHALQGFVATARSGNVSRAAESLHLTVSALSHQIRGLEERVGLRLFVRGARGVQLTEDGRALFERIAPHFDAIEQALHAVPRAPRRCADLDADAVVRLGLAGAAIAALPRRASAAGDQPAVERGGGRPAARDVDRCRRAFRSRPLARGGSRASVRRLDHAHRQPGTDRTTRAPDPGNARRLPVARRARWPLEPVVRTLRRHSCRRASSRPSTIRKTCTAPRPKDWASRWDG